ncbi:MAG: PadR family transcriptional regulator [Micropepsaceae bacterium]
MAPITPPPDDKLEQELRRGVIVLAALSQLAGWQYGYSLRQSLAARGMEIEEGTLYPLLRRLEAQNLLVSEWRIEEGPPRRYYKMSPAGRALYGRLIENWNGLVDIVAGLVADDGTGTKRKKDGR